MTESKAKGNIITYFKQKKNKYIRKYGRKPMSNFEIDDECSALFKKWKGCYMQNELKTYKPGYYILNVDTRNNEGIHWISLVVCSKNAYIFDSFGRDTNKILPILKKNLDKQGLKIIESDKMPIRKVIAKFVECFVLPGFYVVKSLELLKQQKSSKISLTLFFL